MKITLQLLRFSVLLLLFSCSNNEETSDSQAEKPTNPITVKSLIKAADMSYLPLIESEGTVYKRNNVPEDALLTLKKRAAIPFEFGFGKILPMATAD